MTEQNVFDLVQQRQADVVISAPAQEADEDAELSNSLIDQYESESQEWRDEMIEDYDFFLGAQVSKKQDETAKKRKQKTFGVDVIFQAVEQAVALLTANRPRFSATGQEDSDTRISHVFALMMQYIGYVNNFVAKLKVTIREYYVGSVGWMYVWWNPQMNGGKGEFCIDTIDPKNVYVSKEAKELFWADAPHILVKSYLTSEQLQRKYNMTVEQVASLETEQQSVDSSERTSEFNKGSAAYTPSQTTTFRKVDRFSRVKSKVFVLEKDDERFEYDVEPEDLQRMLLTMQGIAVRTVHGTNYYVHPRNVNDIMKVYYKHGQVWHEVETPDGGVQIVSGAEGQVEYQEGFRPVPGSTVYIEFLTYRDLVMKGIISVRQDMKDRIKHVGSVGSKVLYSVVIPTEHHVLIPLINNFDRTTEPVGDVRRVKREQDFITSIRQLIVTHAAVTTNFKIGYPDGRYTEADLNKRWNDPMQRFIPYDAEMSSSGLQVLAPPPLPNHLYQLEAQARKNVEERLGIFALMQGSPADAPSTYKATVALDEYGQRRMKSKRDDIENFIDQIGKVIVSLVPKYYTDTRVIHVVAPNDKPQTVVLRKASIHDNLMADNEYRINDITTARCDVMVISGSTLPSNRFALLEMYAELFKIGLLDQETVLKKTEVANVEEVMEKIGIIQQQARMIEELQGQIKKQAGDLQTAEREVVHAKRVADMTNFQKDVEIEKIKAVSARMIYESELKSRKPKE